MRELGVAGYAGVPLLTTDGQAIGAFCAFDDRPRTWTADDLQTLEDLAAATMTEVELRATTAAMRARAATLREEGATLEIINHVGRLLTAELDLATLVQAVTDAATVSPAPASAFFYNALDERGEYYTLYAIAGVPREAFEQFPLPRNTALFGPTFRGEGHGPHCRCPRGRALRPESAALRHAAGPLAGCQLSRRARHRARR